MWSDTFPSNLFVQNAMQTLQQGQPGFWKYYFQMIFQKSIEPNKQLWDKSFDQHLSKKVYEFKNGKERQKYKTIPQIFWSDEVLKPRTTANDVTTSAIMVQCKMIHYQSHWLSKIVLSNKLEYSNIKL